MKKQTRALWTSLLAVLAVTAIALGAVLAAGWSPKLGLDLDGGLSVVYQTHTPVSSAELDTIVTILNNRVNNGTSGATVSSQGKNQISVSVPGAKNSQQILASLGNTGQLFFRPALCYANAFTLSKGQTASTAPLPAQCAAPYQLTAANLGVTPDSNSTAGYTSKNVGPDPQFTTTPSTPATADKAAATVLIPGSRAAGTQDIRYLLGPAARAPGPPAPRTSATCSDRPASRARRSSRPTPS